MQAVFNALVPVFLLVALGVFLKRTLLRSENVWEWLKELIY